MPESPHLPIFIATVLGAVALLLMMPRARGDFRIIGGVLGAAAVAGLWFVLSRLIVDLGGISWTAFTYYYVFSAIAIFGAVRVITHTRPVYSALWFVMVVLASAGLFITLAAEFMAFAIIIIYAGAILVTYMFVIMLASQSVGDTDNPDVSPHYDRIAREPLAATVVGFVLLAVLLSVAFEPMEREPRAAAITNEQMLLRVLPNRPVPTELTPSEAALLVSASQTLPAEAATPAADDTRLLPATHEDARLSNAERVGVDLFREHPLGIELAGVILLISLIGAVVIARTQVPDDRKRLPADPDATGATVTPRHEPGPDEPQSMGRSGGRMGV